MSTGKIKQGTFWIKLPKMFLFGFMSDRPILASEAENTQLHLKLVINASWYVRTEF